MAGYKLYFVLCIFLYLLSLALSREPSVLKLHSDDENRIKTLEIIKPADDEQRLLYAVLRVADLNRTIEFYAACFGMVLFHKVDRPWLSYSYAVVGYGSPQTHFFLKLIYNYGSDSIDVGNRFNHFGVLTQDTNLTVDKVVANGGVVSEPPDRKADGTVVAFVFDPSGYLIEITQPDPADPANESIIIDHINFRVTHMNRSLDYYQRALNISLLYSHNLDAMFGISLLSHGNKFQTTALELTYVQDSINTTRGNGYSHFAVSTDDVFKSAEIIRNVTQENGGRLIEPTGRIYGTLTCYTAFIDLLGWEIVLLEDNSFFDGSI